MKKVWEEVKLEWRLAAIVGGLVLTLAIFMIFGEAVA